MLRHAVGNMHCMPIIQTVAFLAGGNLVRKRRWGTHVNCVFC